MQKRNMYIYLNGTSVTSPVRGEVVHRDSDLTGTGVNTWLVVQQVGRIVIPHGTGCAVGSLTHSLLTHYQGMAPKVLHLMRGTGTEINTAD